MDRVRASTFFNTDPIDHVYSLFPRTFPHIDIVALNDIKRRHHNSTTARWLVWDSLTDDGLPAVQVLFKFLNEISAEILATHEIRCNGIWTREISPPPPARYDAHSSTLAYTSEPSWEDVVCHIEYCNQDDRGMDSAFRKLVEGAILIATHQIDRKFHIGLRWAGEEFQIFTFDAAGIVVSRPINIHKDTFLFLYFLAGVLVFPPAFQGFDGTIDIAKRLIRCESLDLQITQYPQLQRRSFMGRRTQCFIARDENGREYAVKDYWVRTEDISKEADILLHLRGTDGIPEITSAFTVEFATVVLDGTPVAWKDFTDRRRSFIPSDDDNWARVRYSNWVHFRLVMTPVAVPLTAFTSRSELLDVFIDTLRAHKEACERGILHHDISINNIMITKSPHPEFGRRAGLLIDFDLALDMDEETMNTPGDRVGTDPFISTEVLRRPVCPSVSHDLEAFFYVFIWICICQTGPNNQARSPKEFDPYNEFRSWYDDNDGKDKNATMMSDNLFFDRVICSFSVYFRDFKACACRLRDVLFDLRQGKLRRGVTHDQMLDILEDTVTRRHALGWQDAINANRNLKRLTDPLVIEKYTALLSDESDQAELRRIRRYVGGCGKEQLPSRRNAK